MQHFSGHGATCPDVRFRFSSEQGHRSEAVIARRGQAYDVILSDETLRPPHSVYLRLARRAAPMLYFLHSATGEVAQMRVHLSDGDKMGGPAFYYSSLLAEASLVPDLYFFEKQGFQDLRGRIATDDVPWQQRDNKLVWRGSPTGAGLITTEPTLMTSPAVHQRVRCAHICSENGIDFGFVLPQDDPHRYGFQQSGWLKERVQNTAWFGKKFALDIDGFANTWDNLFHRMLMGCCVLKVAGMYGYRQWYYDRLKAWEHYVPVAADLSDLVERYEWVQANDDAAREIAQNARTLALAMSFDKEVKVAANSIEENWKRFN